MKTGERHNYHATVASRIPGRIRVRLDSHARRSHTLQKIKDHLEAQAGVSDVQVNHTTGSVTVRYDRQKLHEAGVFDALRDIDVLVSYVAGEAGGVSGPEGSCRSLAEAINDLNRRLHVAGVPVDLRLLTPLAFLGAGVWSILRGGLGMEKIPGIFFVWLALDAFVKLHPQVAPKTADHPAA